MLVSSITHWKTERSFVHPVIRRAIDYLAEMDWGMLEVGKYPIWGDDMFALVMENTTKPIAEQPAEKHEHFLDIHYLLHGEETIGWKLQDGHTQPSQAYDPQNDFALFAELEEETLIKLTPGMYIVLFPEDIHRPCIAVAEATDVRKVVVKINKDLL